MAGMKEVGISRRMVKQEQAMQRAGPKIHFFSPECRVPVDTGIRNLCQSSLMTPREIKAAHFLKKPLQPHVADRRYPALVKLPTGASGNSEPLRHLPMENFAFPKKERPN